MKRIKRSKPKQERKGSLLITDNMELLVKEAEKRKGKQVNVSKLA